VIGGLGDNFASGLRSISVLLVLGGVFLGAAAHAGCGYVRRHVNVEWAP
jgi:hypothetical protein